MVDNVAITPGSGATVAADDVGGVLYQRVKLALGADGTASDAPVGTGTASGVLRIVAASDSPEMAKLDSILSELQSQATSVPHEALDTTTDLSRVFDTSSASGERTLVTATASQTTRGYRMIVTAAGATVIEFRDGAGGSAMLTLEFPAAGAYVLDFSARPYFKTTANTALVRNSTAAVKVTVTLDYVKSA